MTEHKYKNNSFYQEYFKPFIDKAFGVISLLIFSPFLLLVITSLFITNGSNVFFVQERSGKNCNKFKIYKFRTIQKGLDKPSKLGYLLRKSHIDELPQLMNIIKGDMSFIGPRPLLCEYDSLYTDYHKNRFIVKPGILGLAQVSRPISWEEKLNYDIEYVNKIGLFIDLMVILIAIKNSFQKRAKTNLGASNLEVKLKKGYSK